MELVGKLYPIKDLTTNRVVDHKTITKAIKLTNISGYVISINENDPDIFVTHQQASQIAGE